MKKHILLAACMVFGLGLAWQNSARASEVLYDATGFVVGQQSFVTELNISGPGTLTVTLSNINWPEQLATLNLVVGTASGLMGPEMGAGTESFNVTSGQVFAQWFGTAQGPLGVGVYSLNVVFQPDGAMAVPLPTSVLLLISGLALLGWQRLRNRETPATVAG